MTKSFILLLTTLSFVACSSAKKNADGTDSAATQPPTPAPTATSIEAKQVAAKEQAAYVTEVQFSKGKRRLRGNQIAKITQLVKDAEANGKVEDIKIIGWADSEYPSTSTKKLSKAQLKLASDRNDELKKIVRRIDRTASVQEFNMAKRPNGFQELLETSDARIKKSLEVAGIPNTDTNVKVPSKASKAIVMIILRE